MESVLIGDIESNLLWNIRDIIEYGVILERKALVNNLPKIGKLHIYKDHNPPHFHIITKNLDLVIRIEDCIITKGQLNSKKYKSLENWYLKEGGKEKIISFWNRFNPDNKI